MSTKSCFKLQLSSNFFWEKLTNLCMQLAELSMQKGQPVTISSLLHSWFWPTWACDNNQKIGLIVPSAQLWSSFLWLRHFEYQRTQAPRERYEWRPRGPRGAGRQLQEIQELSHPYMLIVTGFWHGWCSPSLFRYSRCLKFAFKTHTPYLLAFLSPSLLLILAQVCGGGLDFQAGKSCHVVSLLYFSTQCLCQRYVVLVVVVVVVRILSSWSIFAIFLKICRLIFPAALSVLSQR